LFVKGVVNIRNLILRISIDYTKCNKAKC
jgi:hypothetical protein